MRKTLQHVLVAVDLEPKSLAVLSRAIEIAAVSSCTLTVLHVVEVGRDAFAGVDDLLDSRSAYQHLLNRARKAVELLVSECRKTRVQFDVVVKAGQASTVILDVDERIRAYLVVIGISNRTSIRERMIDSTADQVIRGSRASVLVIKGPAKAFYNCIIAAIDFSPQSEAAATAASVLLSHARVRLVYVTSRTSRMWRSTIIQNSWPQQRSSSGFRLIRSRRSSARCQQIARPISCGI